MTYKNAIKYLDEAPETGDARLPGRFVALCRAMAEFRAASGAQAPGNDGAGAFGATGANSSFGATGANPVTAPAVSPEKSRPAAPYGALLTAGVGSVRFSSTRVGHVACDMTASVLDAAGYTVGVFDPESAGDARERVTIGGQPLSHDDLTRGVERLADAVRRVTPILNAALPPKSASPTAEEASTRTVSSTATAPVTVTVTVTETVSVAPIRRQRPALLHAHPFSRAELWLALAILMFREAGCDFILLIRAGTAHKDPTLIAFPVGIEVIAGIAEHSGMTQAAACSDACAGLKALPREGGARAAGDRSGVREAVGCSLDNAQYRHVMDACSKAGIRFSVPLRSEAHTVGQTLHKTLFSYRGKDGFSVRGGSEVRLTAALCAIEVCFALRRTGVEIPTEKIREGVARQPNRGLLEPLSLEPDVLLDVLTGPGDATATLTDLFRLRSPEGRFWLIADAAFLPDLRNALNKLPAACQPGILFCCGNVASDDEVPGIPERPRDGGPSKDGQEPIDTMPVEDVANVVFDRAPAAILADFLRECRPDDLLFVMGGAAFVAEAKRVFRERM